MAGDSSWLLAAPATARQRRRETVAAEIAPPRAHGAKMSHSASKMASFGTNSAEVALAIAAARRASMSATMRRAPFWCSSRARCEPTAPTP
jgi:hypothetical protein